MTTTSSWLPLAEYSIKHHVSISTLRRRIKAEDIAFRFDEGKYFLCDENDSKKMEAEMHRPSLSCEAAKINSAEVLSHQKQGEHITQLQISETGESVLTAANKLLVDLKKAYTQILQEKEEQIMFLREETVDLKTLIKVLESENSRLHQRM